MKRIDEALLLALIVILGIIGAILMLIEIAWSRQYVDSPVNIGGPPNWMVLMGMAGIGLMFFPTLIITVYVEAQAQKHDKLPDSC